MRGIHRWPVNSPHKGPVTRKMFPSDDVIVDSPVVAVRFVDRLAGLVEHAVLLAWWAWCLAFLHDLRVLITLIRLVHCPVTTCGKTCFVGLLIRSIFRGKHCTSASARVQFFQQNIERINRPIRHMSCWSVNSFDFWWKILQGRFSGSAVFPAKNQMN